jgi:ABC-type sugar transport system ATPase subunit
MTGPQNTRARERNGGILALDGVSLAFGGVQALREVSFDVREHEVRAIIGPNGAGKSSMLNVINGVYHPQQGTIRYLGREYHDMDPHEVAVSGISRTFQNLTLFKGMSVLDNIMSGRNLKMHSNILLQALRIGPALREGWRTGRWWKASSTSWRSSTSARRRSAGFPTDCRSASSLRARSRRSRRCCCSTSRWPA